MQSLQKWSRWLCWQITQDGGSFKKFPVNPGTGNAASCDKPDTWASHDAAAAAMLAHSYEAIGFVLGKEVGLVVVDFDKVRPDPESDWPQWVLDEVEDLDSYTEISASGCGLHVLVYGSIPSNMNRQKCHTEIWDCDKMFAFSGAIFQGRDKIQARDVTGLHARIESAHIGPDYTPEFIVERYNTPRFRDIINDEWAKHGLGSRSAAVASALWTLASKHEYNADKMREEFEVTPLCAAWEEKGKWSRLGDREIERAIAMVRANAPKKAPLSFIGRRVEGHIREYVLLPIVKYDGWFPRGRVSIVGGPSGGGKTSLIVDLLDQQFQGKKYLGHATARLPYVVLFADRGELSNQETLERMGLLEREDLCIDHMPELVYDRDAAIAVKECVERRDVLPAVVFVEGCDLLVSDPNKAPIVGSFLKDLQRIAQFYHIAIVLSVGAPKAKEKDMHTLKRDRIFGSQIWSRMCETIATLSIPGDGTGNTRALDVQHRNAASESFELEFHNGLLRAVSNTPTSDDPLLIWCSTQTEPFTRAEAVKAMADADAGMARSTVYTRVVKLLTAGTLTQEFNGSTVLLKWKQPVLTPEENELNVAVSERSSERP